MIRCLGGVFAMVKRILRTGFFVATLSLAVASVSAATTERQESSITDQGLGPTPALTQQDILAGWLSLFDGETLFGWKAVSDANWHVSNGEIRVSSGTSGLLRTTTQFDDFELILDFKCGDQTNSGIFLRTSPEPQNPLTDCYELNIAARQNHRFPTGSLVNRAATELDFSADQWHELRVLVNHSRFQIWIDDKKSLQYEDSKPLGRGYVGLQFNSGAIAFRNIRLKPLNLPEVEVSDDLAKNWNLDRQMESEFSASKLGELKIQGGRGQIETRRGYGDFILSLLCRTNADGLNSGIFFRCMAGEVMNGYESQIQNQFIDGDRSKPVDCGTGGIFRRINARKVNANDQQWFAKTIVVTGPHVAVWVNGYLVTDWTDRREPHENPRKGLRLGAGTIIIQGHDPTTDILMKEIKVRELQPRGK